MNEEQVWLREDVKMKIGYNIYPSDSGVKYWRIWSRKTIGEELWSKDADEEQWPQNSEWGKRRTYLYDDFSKWDDITLKIEELASKTCITIDSAATHIFQTAGHPEILKMPKMHLVSNNFKS